MRSEPSVLHLDLDAFYAAVEQRDKPSLRGKPVVVGGVGPRGVVATASYEARAYGIGSAMSTAEARRRCPNAAFLAPRFAAYRAASEVVMAVLRSVSPLVEPLSLDEAYVDLAAGGHADLSAEGVRRVAADVRAEIKARTGLSSSVGAASTKLLAKIASDLDKPDGLVVVPPGEELAVLHPLPVGRLWGVGPVTAQRLNRLGAGTVAELARMTEDELVGVLGQAQGRLLHRLARGEDDRPVLPERETKSIGVEETFPVDLADRARLRAELDVMVARTARRLAAAGHSGRTVTVKVRLHDFRTLARSATLPAPTDDEAVVRRLAHALLAEIDVSGGLRLLGVTVSALSDQVQGELPDLLPEPAPAAVAGPAEPLTGRAEEGPRYAPGADVVHAAYGPGWVQGSGVGRVTVRFETAASPPGRVLTFPLDDPELRPGEPLPPTYDGGRGGGGADVELTTAPEPPT